MDALGFAFLVFKRIFAIAGVFSWLIESVWKWKTEKKLLSWVHNDND